MMLPPHSPATPPPCIYNIYILGAEVTRARGRRAYTRTFVSQIMQFTASRRANVKKNDNGRKTRQKTTERLARAKIKMAKDNFQIVT